MKKNFQKNAVVTILLMFLLCFSCMTVNAASYRLNKTNVTLGKWKTCQLTVSGSYKKIFWESSNGTIATVSSKGKVTGLNSGTAIITATIDKKKELTCKVTVKTDSNSSGNLTDETMGALGLVLIKETLKDPSSLVVNRISVGYQDENYGGTIYKNVRNVLIDYNAKNSFGGSVRKYATISIFPKKGKPPEYITHPCMKSGTYLVAGTYDHPIKLKQSKNISIEPILSKMQQFWDEGKYKVYSVFF